MTIRLLTSDTVRAEALSGYIARDWSACPNLLAGYSVAFGPVTRVMFLQTLADNGVPPDPPAPIDPDHLISRHVGWLRECSSHRPVSDGVTVLELRSYDVRVGLGAEFLKLMLAALPIRERYSRNFGVWETLSGRRERILHLWGYRDLAARNAVREQLKGDADWSDYVATILPMLDALTTTLLQPLPKC